MLYTIAAIGSLATWPSEVRLLYWKPVDILFGVLDMPRMGQDTQRLGVLSLFCGLLLLVYPALAEEIPTLRDFPAAQRQAEAVQGQQPSSTPAARSISVDSSTQRIPVGTLLKLRFTAGLDSRFAQSGDPFTATLVDDLSGQQGNLLLPRGTALRGRVMLAKRSQWFGRGGEIDLAFDHVVLPNGDLAPLPIKLSRFNPVVSKTGTLYADPGLVPKLNKAGEEGGETFYKWLNGGVDYGKELGDGLGLILTVPVAAVGGAVHGSAVTAGKGLSALVGKGDSVQLKPDDVLILELTQPVVLPVSS